MANGADRRGELAQALELDPVIDDLLYNAIEDSKTQPKHKNANFNQTDRLTGGENKIYYGAPGTGKSHKVEQLIDELTTVRTVFHPDTQNSDFIGALKPVIQNGDVSYQFSPGPFARAMAAAYDDPSNMHYLVIEELNRAPAAAVFGELFLMLDRNDDGKGEYDVDFPSDEFANWWKAETGNDTHKMRLPSNLSILATMNSADQGVYPLDTAFRRRWTQKYIPINYTKAPTGHIKLALSASSEKEIEWADFIRRLNEFLISETSLAISEDRLIGPWFLKASELNDVLPGKLLIYLWDDLLRHQGRDIIFHSSIKTYGDLALTVEKKKLVFSKSFLEGFLQEQEQAE